MDRNRTRLIGLYLLIQLAGIAGIAFQQTSPVPASTSGSLGGIQLFGMLLVATVTMLALIKYSLYRLLRAWFGISMFFTALIYCSVFVSPPLALGIAVAAAVVRRHVPDLWIRDAIDGLSFAGAGVLFGMLVDLPTAVGLLIVIGIYDVVAVYGTHHMVDLAKGGIENGAFAGLMYPKEGDGTVSASGGDGGTTVGIVGGGDIVMPLMLAATVTGSIGVVAGLFVAIGATAGLAALFHLSDEDSFYPAIPAVGGGGLLGLGLALVLYSL